MSDREREIRALDALAQLRDERDTLREALELKDGAYAHLQSGQKAKAERLARDSWKRRHGQRLEGSALSEAPS